MEELKPVARGEVSLNIKTIHFRIFANFELLRFICEEQKSQIFNHLICRNLETVVWTLNAEIEPVFMDKLDFKK